MPEGIVILFLHSMPYFENLLNWHASMVGRSHNIKNVTPGFPKLSHKDDFPGESRAEFAQRKERKV